MKNFVIKYIDIKTGLSKFFECRAMNQMEAIDTMFESIDLNQYHVQDCYMNTEDVFEFYNIR